MQIFIYYNLNQQYYDQDFDSSDTIQGLSERIENLTGVFPATGSLYHNNEQLNDLSKTLFDYGIQKFHTVVFQNPFPPCPPCPTCPSCPACPKSKYGAWILTVSILSFFLILLFIQKYI